MTDEVQRLLGSLEAQTKNMAGTLVEIKTDINYLFDKFNTQKSTIDKLKQEHDDRMKQGAECHQTVNVPPITKGLIGLIAGSNGATAFIFLIIILLLKKWGWL